MTPTEFIKNIEQLDDNSPDDDFDPNELAANYAADHCNEDVRAAARMAVQQLFRGLAHVVLDGFISARPSAFDASDVISWLQDGSEIGSTAMLTEFLIANFDVPPDDALAVLFELLETEADHERQNKLAYACWYIVNGRMFLVQEGKLVGFLHSPVDQEIASLIALPSLSDYARQTLSECRKR